MTTAKYNTDEPPRPAGGKGSPLAQGAPQGEVTNLQLLRRMLRFLRPVTKTAVLCGILILLWVFLETNANNVNRKIVNYIDETFRAHVGTAEPAASQPGAPVEGGVEGAAASAPGEVRDAAPGAGAVAASQAARPQTFWESFRAGPLQTVAKMTAVLGLLVLCNCIVAYFRWVMNMRFTMDMVYHMRAAVYDRLQRVGFAFHDEHSSGQLINRALSDLQNVRSFLQTALVSIIEIVAFVIGYNVLIFAVSPWIAAVAFIPIPFWIWYITSYSKKMQPAQREQMKAGDELVTVFTENVAGVHVVKAFATQPTEVKKYNAVADMFFGKVMATVNLQRNFTPTVRGIASASHLSLFAVGAIFVVQGHLKVGDLLLFGQAMGAILGRLQQISMISDQYQKAIVSARRFFEVLDAPDTVPVVPNAPPLPTVKGGGGAVEFNFVTFGYTPEKPVVKDISFEIDAGSVVALVGPTGAGKTTLMQLLARFYDPQNGHILIDGVDVRKVDIMNLRKQIGFVFQETFLFSDTVANNIRYGNPDAGIGEVEAAARIAQAHDFIMELPNGYSTMLGERGASLSGGQRQRLAIARAIVSNPRILVLDDALAAVDPETEHLISRALELVMVDRTVFIIAHRLSTVKAADVVIVVEHGRITQAGTHKELMREAGHYRHIAEVQLAYQEKEIIAEAQKKKDILEASHHGLPAVR